MRSPSLAGCLLVLAHAINPGHDRVEEHTRTREMYPHVSKEREQKASQLYQRGRTLFEAGRLEESLPFFEKASQQAPEFPEPYVARAQALNRLGRAADAQALLAEAQRRLPASPAHGAGSVASAESMIHTSKSAAAMVARNAPPGFAPVVLRAVPRAMQLAADLNLESQELIMVMASSQNAQDQHNARIHHKEHVESEVILRRIISSPLDLQAWWELALSTFNARREYHTASVAFEIVIMAAQTPLAVLSYFLLFHAWQQLCDWRDQDTRLRLLQDRLRNTTEAYERRKGPPSSEYGPGESMEAPYIMLVSRLVDIDPMLVQRSFIRHAQIMTRAARLAMKDRGKGAIMPAARQLESDRPSSLRVRLPQPGHSRIPPPANPPNAARRSPPTPKPPSAPALVASPFDPHYTDRASALLAASVEFRHLAPSFGTGSLIWHLIWHLNLARPLGSLIWHPGMLSSRGSHIALIMAPRSDSRTM